MLKQRDPSKGVAISDLDPAKGPRGGHQKSTQENPAGAARSNEYKGMRSPLLGSADMGQTNGAAQTFAENPSIGQPHDPNDPFAGTGPQVLQFRAPPKKSKMTPWIALILVIVGGILYIETIKPELADQIHARIQSQVKQSKEQLPLYINPNSNRSTTKVLTVESPTAGLRAIGTKKAFDPLRLGCDKILAMLKNSDTEMTSRLLQVATECSYARLDYLAALRLSDAALTHIRKTSESVSSEIWLMRTKALMSMGLGFEAEQTIGNNCEKWIKSAPCVAKLHLFVKRGMLAAAASGFLQLERQALTKGNRIDVNLMVAAANIASQLGQFDTAERRLQLAIKYAPEDSPFSWKEIFEARMWNAARKKDAALSGKILGESRNNVFVDPKTFGIKLSVINSLAVGDHAKLNAYFVETKMPRAKLVDIEFFEALTYEAIKRNLLNSYLPYYSLLRKNLQPIKELNKPNQNLLDLLQARIYIAQNKPNKSYTVLKNMQGTAIESATATLLRGVSLHLLATNDQYNIQALTEFINSYRLYPTWQALWAAGHLYSVLGQGTQAKSLVTRLKKEFGSEKEAAQWTALLDFRINSMGLSVSEADVAIDKRLNQQATHPYLWQIKLDYLQKSRRFDLWQNLDRQILKRGLLTSNVALPEMKGYPLSALVLTH